MLAFQELVRKNLSEKFQGFRMLGTLGIGVLRKHFDVEKKDENLIQDEVITWYLQYQILFVKTSDQVIKIELFKQKRELIEKINQHFSSLGYQQKIVDLRLK